MIMMCSKIVHASLTSCLLFSTPALSNPNAKVIQKIHVLIQILAAHQLSGIGSGFSFLWQIAWIPIEGLLLKEKGVDS